MTPTDDATKARALSARQCTVRGAQVALRSPNAGASTDKRADKIQWELDPVPGASAPVPAVQRVPTMRPCPGLFPACGHRPSGPALPSRQATRAELDAFLAALHG